MRRIDKKLNMQKVNLLSEQRYLESKGFINESLKNIIKEERIKFELNVPQDIIDIKNVFKKRKHKLYVVGGAVRDALLGKTPKDWDLATDATPDKVELMMDRAGYRTLPTGKAFGVINVFTDDDEYEIATFRRDLSGGRRPDAVEFTTIDQDVKRRDLTINALFYDIDSGEIVDLVGGVDDINKGIVRTVGSPEERFGEDRLRILRALRFAGRFGSDLEPNVDATLKQDSSLEGISKERIRDEFIKGLKTSKSAKYFLGLVDTYDMWGEILPGLSINKNYIDDKDVIINLATLLKDNDVSNLRGILNKLTYSNDEIKNIQFLINLNDMDADNVSTLKRMQRGVTLTDNQILDYAKHNGLDMNLINAFLKFNLSVKGGEAMQRYGLTKKDKSKIGQAIKDLEAEKFKELL
jgi:tRNA nucleotidyltransferase/poly(A) polymerase